MSEEQVELTGEGTTDQTDESGAENVVPEEESPQHSPEVKGILVDLQKQRKVNEDLQRQIAMMQEQHSALLSEMHPEGEQEGAEAETLDDEELLNRGEARKMVQAERAYFAKQQVARERIERQNVVMRSRQQAMQAHTAEREGKGLDYETVISEGFQAVMQDATPQEAEALQAAVLASANPAETAYRLGCTHPTIQKRVRAASASQLLRKMGEGGRPPGLELPAGAPPDMMDMAHLIKCSDKEFETLLRKHG
jgi:hypothetical protein